jgi:site-specific DNA recombinase
MTNEKIKYFLYSRKSSESEDRQVQSIEDQESSMKQIATRAGLEIVEILSESKTAKLPNNRLIYSEMIRRIRKGEANGILCWHINRLSRNPVDSGELSWLLQTGVIQSIQTAEKEYKPDDNVLLMSVESGMANQFIIDLRKSSRRGMEGKADRGWLPSRAPIGYLNDKATNTIIKDPLRFDIVRKMWDLMLTGRYTPHEIGDIASKKWGLTTPVLGRSGGKPVSHSGLYRLFGNHGAMITLKEFNMVQSILGRKDRPRFYKHNPRYAGLLHCPCGAAVTTSIKRKFVKKTGTYEIYQYNHCSRRVDPTCKEPAITQNNLEEQIFNVLDKVAIAPEFLAWAFETIDENKNDNAQIENTIIQNRQQSITQKQQEMRNLTRMRSRDLISELEFIEERSALEQEIKELTETVSVVETAAEKREALKDKFRFMAELKDRFINNPDDRPIILSEIGGDHTLQNKVFGPKTHDWMIPVLTTYKNLENDYRRLELANNLSTAERNEEFSSIRRVWGAYWDLNPD